MDARGRFGRRAFLTAGGVVAAGALVPGRLMAALETEARRAGTPAAAGELNSWAGVRALFNLAPGWAHLSGFYLVSHPRPVREAVDQFRRVLDENPFITLEHSFFGDEAHSLERAVKLAAARYMGGSPDEIALTGSTTAGLALVYTGLPLKAGDELLLSTHDHYVHHEAARMAAERAGAATRRVALYDRGAEADRGQILERLRRAIRPETRVLGLTWVHSSSGVRLPIRAIADLVAEVNRARPERSRLLFVVDGVHGFGCSDEPEAKLGCDFFCAGTHKWLFGPRGTGLVWAPIEHWGMMRPTVPTFSDLSFYESWGLGKAPPPVNARAMTPGGFHAYEHVWGVRAAFELHEGIGRARVAARIRELNARCREGLAAVHGVTLHTPRDPALSAGIQCFEIAGRPVEECVARLEERKIVASGSPYLPSYLRLAPSLVNDTADVDRALAAVAALAHA